MITGLYVPGNSLIHRLSAGTKLLALAAAGISLFLFGDGWLLAMVGAGVAWIFVSGAGLGWRRLWTVTRPLLIWLALIAATQLWLADAQSGVVVIVRLLALVWLAALVTYTTKLTDMSEALAKMSGMLRPFGVSPDRFAFLIALTIRLIPAVFESVADVRDAQRARGLERAYLAAFVPVLTRLFRQADSLSDALVARGYDRWGQQ